MSALDEVQAAISKLSTMQAETRYFEVNGWLCEEAPGDTLRTAMTPDGGPSPLTNDPIIVTLHRGIDAQLAILTAASHHKQVNYEGVQPHSMVGTAISLARSINGTT